MLAMPPMSGTNLATNPGWPRFGKLKVLYFCCLVAKLCPTPCEHGLQRQASLPFTISWSLLRLTSIESVMLSKHLILCYPLLLPSILSQHQDLSERYWCFSISSLLFMGVSRQAYWSGLPFPPPVFHTLSELSTVTCLSWVARYYMTHSFIELLWAPSLL